MGKEPDMAINVVALHHHGIRIDNNGHSYTDVHDFYANVLGLTADEGRPFIPGVPGWWINVGDNAQIHLIGGPDPSPACKAPGQDPAAPHVALAVDSIVATQAELERLGVDYFTNTSVSPDFMQLFVKDPSGNLIELHQHDKCRCTLVSRVV